EPLRRSANEPVIECGMTHIADNQNIEALLLDKINDARHGMACYDVSCKLDMLRLRLRDRFRYYLREPVVGLQPFLDHLIDRGWKARQLLDRNHMKSDLEPSCQQDCGIERFCGSRRAIMGNQDLAKHFRSL